MIFAIDPGSTESAYVVMEEKTLKPIKIAKVSNGDLMDGILWGDFNKCTDFAVEMVASYGMAVGAEVFETCVWIGKFVQAIEAKTNIEPTLIYRKDEKMNLCHTMRAKDSNIIQALADRFAPGVQNKGKGIKSNKGWFYGFKKDIWQAYAVGVTYNDLYINRGN